MLSPAPIVGFDVVFVRSRMSSKATVAKQRDIQWQVARADEKPKNKPSGAMQAEARMYPEPPLP